MDNEWSYNERIIAFRANLVELVDEHLLQEYDAIAELFQAQEARHHKEMHEAVSGLLRKRPIPRKVVKTYVYLVVNQAGTQVKIGLSSSPQRRVRTLSTGNADPLHLLYYVVGGRSLEKALHSKFKQHHIRNEWYACCSEIKDEFSRLSATSKGLDSGIDVEGEVRT